MNERILVADDDLELLQAIGDVLVLDGYRVTRVHDGAALIEALADRSYDLLVTDISMPWMTGLQVSHSARYAGLQVPIVVITALRDENLAADVAALGPHTRLLRKPFAIEDLEGAIHDLLAARGSARSAPEPF